MNYPITELDKIAPGVGEILKANKIRTTNRLLDAARTHKKRLELAKTTGVPASAILRCTTMSDRLRVKGIGREPSTKVTNGGLDANWMVKHGIPTVTFGAGQNDIHTVKEWVDVPEFLEGCKLAVELAKG